MLIMGRGNEVGGGFLEGGRLREGNGSCGCFSVSLVLSKGLKAA